MLSILFNILVICLLFYLMALAIGYVSVICDLISKVIPINEWGNYIPTPLNAINFGNNELTDLAYITLIILLIVILVLCIFFGYNLFSSKGLKTKREKLNYTSLQSRFERKRALYRVMWAKDGHCEMGVLERWYDVFFDDFIKFHNWFMSEYNRPKYEFWNQQSYTKVVDGENVIESLNVNTSKQGEDEWD